MAIDNLSGNFQPLSLVKGNKLPDAGTRVSSSEVQEVSTTNSRNTDSAASRATVQTAQPKASEADAINKIEEFQNYNLKINRSLKFKVDEELGVTIVRVIDKETDELIRQFPPEELINLSKKLKQLNEENTSSNGILIKEKV